MELPHLGKNCALTDCNQLDFLPYKCHLCKHDFCQDHWRPEQHQCQFNTKTSDVRVPVCPLCEKPVPVNKGENPNRRIDEHIRRGCTDPGTTTDHSPAYRNICSYHACKTKVLVSAKCPSCQKQYCLKHRFEADHRCSKDTNAGGSNRPSRTPKMSMFAGHDKQENQNATKSRNKNCGIS